MRRTALASCLALLLAAAPPAQAQLVSEPTTTPLAEVRKGFVTQLKPDDPDAERIAPPAPPADSGLELVAYDAPPGKLHAYATPVRSDGKKRPAVVYLVGGFDGLGEGLWQRGASANDQSVDAYLAAGAKGDRLVVFCPSFRGHHDNPGRQELFLGEVDDLAAAIAHVARRPDVDPKRIWLVGHSTGGTMALLGAAASDGLAAVVSVGGCANYEFLARFADGYGVEPFDRRGKDEARVRSPHLYAPTLRAPVLYVEGTDGDDDNAYAMMAREMSGTADNFGKALGVAPLPAHDHFSVVRPTNRVLAGRMVAGQGLPGDAEFARAVAALPAEPEPALPEPRPRPTPPKPVDDQAPTLSQPTTTPATRPAPKSREARIAEQLARAGTPEEQAGYEREPVTLSPEAVGFVRQNAPPAGQRLVLSFRPPPDDGFESGFRAQEDPAELARHVLTEHEGVRLSVDRAYAGLYRKARLIMVDGKFRLQPDAENCARFGMNVPPPPPESSSSAATQPAAPEPTPAERFAADLARAGTPEEQAAYRREPARVTNEAAAWLREQRKQKRVDPRARLILTVEPDGADGASFRIAFAVQQDARAFLATSAQGFGVSVEKKSAGLLRNARVTLKDGQLGLEPDEAQLARFNIKARE